MVWMYEIYFYDYVYGFNAQEIVLQFNFDLF